MVNVDREVKWITVAYIPVIPTLAEKGGVERARQLRSAILQRILYLALRSKIGASHAGVKSTMRRESGR